MLSLKTFPYLHRPFSPPLKSHLTSSSPPFFSRITPHFPTLSLSSSSTTPTITMDPTATIEHIVLFKVRDSTDPTKIASMISNLRALSSLDLVTYLTAGPILRPRSAPASALAFTHLLHSRYRSKPDLAAYSAHPDHQSVVRDHVLPICDDIMAVDWVVADAQLPPPSHGSAMRLTLAKPKEAEATPAILAAIDGISGKVEMEQVSCGENFSPARAKGYSVGFISVFRGLEELDKVTEDKDLVEAQKEKVRPLLENVIVLDYVIPSSASL